MSNDQNMTSDPAVTLHQGARESYVAHIAGLESELADARRSLSKHLLAEAIMKVAGTGAVRYPISETIDDEDNSDVVYIHTGVDEQGNPLDAAQVPHVYGSGTLAEHDWKEFVADDDPEAIDVSKVKEWSASLPKITYGFLLSVGEERAKKASQYETVRIIAATAREHLPTATGIEVRVNDDGYMNYVRTTGAKGEVLHTDGYLDDLYLVMSDQCYYLNEDDAHWIDAVTDPENVERDRHYGSVRSAIIDIDTALALKH